MLLWILRMQIPQFVDNFTLEVWIFCWTSKNIHKITHFYRILYSTQKKQFWQLSPNFFFAHNRRIFRSGSKQKFFFEEKTFSKYSSGHVDCSFDNPANNFCSKFNNFSKVCSRSEFSHGKVPTEKFLLGVRKKVNKQTPKTFRKKCANSVEI